MACLDCDGQHPQERLVVQGVCRCCELVDGDKTAKRTRYCKVCQAYICENCRGDLAKRTKAFIADKADKVVEAFKKKVRRRKQKSELEIVEPKKIEFITEEFSKEDEETETPS